MNPEILAAITKAITDAVAPLNAKIDAQAQALDALSNPPQEPTLEDLAQMSEEQLAEIGLTPANVQEALAQIEQENVEVDPAAATDPKAATTDASATTTTTDAAPATSAPAMAAALAALTKQVTELSAEIKAAKVKTENDKVETLFSEIESKVTTLTAENERLTKAIKAGGQPATAGVDRNGVVFFSREKNKGEFEKLVQVGLEEKKFSKAQAFEFARKENPAAYQNYLVRLGVAVAAE